MTQHIADRRARWALLAAPALGLLVLAGCSAGGGSDPSGSADPGKTGFSMMVPQANDADDGYAKLAAEYTKETGVPVEVVPYPAESYTTQVTTQLQGGNAADVMLLVPGGGQAVTLLTVADGGFLEPLGKASGAIIPEGQESLFGADGKVYGQPTALAPTTLVWNGPAAKEAGITEYPTTYAQMLKDCTTARSAGKTIMVVAGAVSFNTGLLATIISADRVYQQDPDWNQQRADGKVTFADSGWREVLNDIVEMNDAGCFQDGVAGGTFDTITQGLGGQTSLSAPVPGSAASQINKGAGLELDVRAFPPAKGEQPYGVLSASLAWTINKASDADVKASAQAFLDWAAEPKQAQTYADLSGYIPITGANASNVAPEYKPIGDLIESGSYTGFPVETWPNPKVYDALSVGIQGLFTGQKTVDQILDEMDAAWDS